MQDRKQTSVTAKLRNAFVCIAAFSVLAAVIGSHSYHVVSTAQRSIIEEALPAARNVEQLVEEGNAVAVFVTSLTTASSLEMLEEQRAYLVQYEQDMLSHLPVLSSYPSVRGAVEELRTGITEKFSTLREKTDIVEERIEVAKRRKQQSVKILSASRTILNATLPAIEEAREIRANSVDQIRRSLRVEEPDTTNLRERFDSLMGREFREVDLLTSIRFETAFLIDEIEALLLNIHTGDYDDEKNKVDSTVRNIAQLATEIKNHTLRQLIQENVQRITRETDGETGIVDNHFATLHLNEKLKDLSAQNRLDVEQLRLLDERLKQSVDQTIESSVLAAERSLWVGRAALIAIAIAAFVAAIWVFRRYVLRDVTERLDRIATVTRQYSVGDMRDDITDAGRDELGDIVRALQLYKTYSLELRRSNADLEKFAYVASHDLKAPLRGISNLAEWIEEDSAENLSEESKKHLDLLKGRVARLNNLLEGLLNYARAGRQDSDLSQVDLKQSVRDTFDLIAAEERFQLKMDSDVPTIKTSGILFEQVMGNLISNAIKHHDVGDGSITVECKPIRNKLEFRVSDDGPGIEEKYHERVFGVFQTIKSRDEVEGSGIGLSIVKKALESVGCDIRIFSNPEEKRGTSFVFTWPVVWPDKLASGM